MPSNFTVPHRYTCEKPGAYAKRMFLLPFPGFPFFTNLDSLRFVERQIIVLQAILKQGAALQEMETNT